MRNTVTRVVLMTALLAPVAALAGEMGVALKGDALRAEPFLDAQTVATLAAGDKVDIIRREGGWLQVKAGGQQGWVRILSIRRGEAHKGTNEVAGVLGLPSGRSGTGAVVAATGIRGMGVGSASAASGVAAASTVGNGGLGEDGLAADGNEQERFEIK